MASHWNHTNACTNAIQLSACLIKCVILLSVFFFFYKGQNLDKKSTLHDKITSNKIETMFQTFKNNKIINKNWNYVPNGVSSFPFIKNAKALRKKSLTNKCNRIGCTSKMHNKCNPIRCTSKMHNKCNPIRCTSKMHNKCNPINALLEVWFHMLEGQINAQANFSIRRLISYVRGAN